MLNNKFYAICALLSQTTCWTALSPIFLLLWTLIQTWTDNLLITWPNDTFENPDNWPSTFFCFAQTPALLLFRFKGILNFTTSIVYWWPNPGSENTNNNNNKPTPHFNNCSYRTLFHLLKPLHVTAWILICCLNGKQLITIHKLPQARLRH